MSSGFCVAGHVGSSGVQAKGMKMFEKRDKGDGRKLS